MPADRTTRIVRVGTGRSGGIYFEVERVTRLRSDRKIFPARNLTSATALRAIGIITPASRSAFKATADVAIRDMPSTFEVADHAGWFGATFVWPNGVCTGEKIPVWLAPKYRKAGSMHDDGTLKAWRKVAKLAHGNTRIMLAICHGFTGPIVDLLSIEAPSIQLVEEAGVYTSSLCSIIALMWGVEMTSWHAITKAGKLIARARHATHLVLDDFRVDQKHRYVDLRARAFRLTQAWSKGRKDDFRHVVRTPILSNSKHSLNEHAWLAGLTPDIVQKALQQRLIDVPLGRDGTDVFEHLHGHKSADDLLQEMEYLAEGNVGVPAERFIRRLCARLIEDRDAWVHWLEALRAFYVEEASAVHENLPGYDLVGVHGHFATIYAAGRLAIAMELFRWNADYLLKAILACEAAHLALAAEEQGGGDLDGSPLTALRRHVAVHRHALVDLREGLLEKQGHDHDRCPGYINSRKDGSVEILFPNALLERLCAGRSGMRLLRCELRNVAALLENKSRPSVKRFIYRGKDPNERENVWAVRADVIDANEHTWP